MSDLLNLCQIYFNIHKNVYVKLFCPHNILYCLMHYRILYSGQIINFLS